MPIISQVMRPAQKLIGRSWFVSFSSLPRSDALLWRDVWTKHIYHASSGSVRESGVYVWDAPHRGLPRSSPANSTKTMARNRLLSRLLVCCIRAWRTLILYRTLSRATDTGECEYPLCIIYMREDLPDDLVSEIAESACDSMWYQYLDKEQRTFPTGTYGALLWRCVTRGQYDSVKEVMDFFSKSEFGPEMLPDPCGESGSDDKPEKDCIDEEQAQEDDSAYIYRKFRR